jgi:hypothetical protein
MAPPSPPSPSKRSPGWPRSRQSSGHRAQGTATTQRRCTCPIPPHRGRWAFARCGSGPRRSVAGGPVPGMALCSRRAHGMVSQRTTGGRKSVRQTPKCLTRLRRGERNTADGPKSAARRVRFGAGGLGGACRDPRRARAHPAGRAEARPLPRLGAQPDRQGMELGRRSTAARLPRRVRDRDVAPGDAHPLPHRQLTGGHARRAGVRAMAGHGGGDARRRRPAARPARHFNFPRRIRQGLPSPHLAHRPATPVPPTIPPLRWQH